MHIPVDGILLADPVMYTIPNILQFSEEKDPTRGRRFDSGHPRTRSTNKWAETHCSLCVGFWRRVAHQCPFATSASSDDGCMTSPWPVAAAGLPAEGAVLTASIDTVS